MKSGVAMWYKSLSQLVLIDSSADWNRLDVLSKWFIATRSAVTTVTIYSSIIGGLLAYQYLHANGIGFNPLMWLVVTIGLFAAHGTNNLLNDYVDYRLEIDKDNYFRLQYGSHPLAQRFWSKNTHLLYLGVTGAIALACGIWALIYTDFAPAVLWLFAVGAVALLFYTYPMKHLGLGEVSIFLIWGPLMIGGVYVVLTGVWSWMVVLASLPVGLTVASVNVGKHTDKAQEDKAKGVHTLPVLIGQTAARYVTMGSVLAAYLVTLYLVFVARFLTPAMLLVLLAVPPGLAALRLLSHPRPTEPPASYPIWPRWFSTVCFVHNRTFSNYFVLALVIDTLIRRFAPAFWH